jgi:hypothetical protein
LPGKKKATMLYFKTYNVKIVIRCATHQRKNIKNKQNNISNLFGRYRSPCFFPIYNTKKELTKLIRFVSCRLSIDKNV